MTHRVLVTGGSGYLGRRTIPRLINHGYQVVALARSATAAEILGDLGAEVVIGNLDDDESLQAAFESARADALMNIASLGFGHAATIVSACEAVGIKRAVFVSTTAIFTRLNARSRAVRVAAEGTIQTSALDYTIVRPTMIYGGPDDRNIARLSKLVQRVPVIPLPGGGSRLQQPVHVEDLADALVACLNRAESIRVEINVAGPAALTFKDIVHQTAASQGRRVATLPLPLTPIIAITRSYERFSRKPRLKAEQFERLAEDKVFDIVQARQTLGYEPRSFADGLGSQSARQAPSQPPLSRRQRIARYARTLSHLRVAQVVARVRLRTQRVVVQRAPRLSQRLLSRRIRDGSSSQWPVEFDPLDRWRCSDVEAGEQIMLGRFTFLNRTEATTDTAIWTRLDIPQLWRFHLHYWDWAWALTAHGDRGTAAFAELWRDWDDHSRFGCGDAWSPYVVSLRLWTLCGLHAHFESAPVVQKEIEQSISTHVAYLRSNVESDVGGNHLIKNLKALLGAGVFLGDEKLTRWATARLTAEVRAQVLADGGHFELSPSYHGQVLGDLIDVIGLLDSAVAAVDRTELHRSIRVMRAWLAEFVGPDGTTPVLNDGVSLETDELNLLGVYAPQEARRLVVLKESGYIVARPRPGLHVVFDVGSPCPDSLPAHSQADCLSLVVSTQTGWAVVDTGTSEYGAGPRRQYERSTAAHNTVEVDGLDQTEVWGAFRAGRRARPTVVSVDDDGECIALIAQHDGYRMLDGRPVHRRHLTIHSNELAIRDEIQGTGRHVVRSRLHFARGSLRQQGDGSMVVWSLGNAEIVVRCDGADVEDADYSNHFGRRTVGHCLVQSLSGNLPLELTWKLQL